MSRKQQKLKVIMIALMTAGVLCLHYLTFYENRYHHAFYRMLFYVPLVLGCFWFGIRGALSIAMGVSILYLPYVVMQWEGFSVEDFDKLLEGCLYLVVAFSLGLLVEREKKKHLALVHARNLAAMGKALSEVAHDMKTPLIAIGGFARQVSEKLGRDDPGRRKLEIVIEETARLESLVKNMLDFGKPLLIQAEKANFNQLVQEALDVARLQAEERGVELRADLEWVLPLVWLDAHRVKQVFLNLLANAIQASPSDETVFIKTRLEGPGILLEVTDCGCGIPAKDSQSIFSPFFSTKKGGAGLGLAIVRKIVDAHGGRVSFRSNSKKGVTFMVWFPLRGALEDRDMDSGEPA